MSKLSVIIPTLQKNINVLTCLINTLDKDKSVSEIILIDNTGNDFNNQFYILSSKLNVIVNAENEYVNPCWNKGIDIAKNEYYALFNDDVMIPDNFCSAVLKYCNEKTGLIGISKDIVINIKPDEYKTIKFSKKSPKVKPANFRNFSYGIIMFGYKNNYHKIPSQMKIGCGDDYLFYMNIKMGIKNYKITNCPIYHLHSLTSSNPIYNPIKLTDVATMKTYFPEWKLDVDNFKVEYNSFFEYILSVKTSSDVRHKILTIFGIRIKIKSKNINKICELK